MRRIQVIDSHTEGEPTRVVIAGAPELGEGTAAERLAQLRVHHDGFRSFVVNEPRGFDALVGALLLPPANPAAVAQVVFFNNVGYLGMCVHGTLGVGETLKHLGRLSPGRHLLETPVGDVTLVLDDEGTLSVENVLSYRHAANVSVTTQHHGTFTGDIAWGGNWFFLIQDHGEELALARRHRLTALCSDVMESLDREGIVGRDGGAIDHVELFSAPTRADADSKNFVLCPGGEYDRSPCGTGTSAKMACLHAAGKLAPGQVWRQESILGSRFIGSVQPVAEGVIPTVSGRAWITSEATLIGLSDDPFREGIRG